MQAAAQNSDVPISGTNPRPVDSVLRQRRTTHDGPPTFGGATRARGAYKARENVFFGRAKFTVHPGPFKGPGPVTAELPLPKVALSLSEAKKGEVPQVT